MHESIELNKVLIIRKSNGSLLSKLKSPLFFIFNENKVQNTIKGAKLNCTWKENHVWF